MAAGILGAALRLLVLTGFGFALFRIEALRRRVLGPLLFLTLNLFLPLYFFRNTAVNWAEVVDIGLAWPAAFFIGCVLLMALQTAYGWWLTRRVPAFRRSRHPRELIALFATHNAGYIPLPILAALAPEALQIYMFFVVLAFNLVFWSFAVNYVSGAQEDGHQQRRGEMQGRRRSRRWRRVRRYRPRVSMPIAGILMGIVVAGLDWYRYLPEPVSTALSWNAAFALDLILVVLGGTLASIPSRHLRYRPEFGSFVVYKLVLFPAVFLALLTVVPLPGVSGELEWGVRLAILLQAAVPPATNLMIVTKRYGNVDQVRFLGSAILFTYLAAALTLPAFMFLAHLLF